jgi:hypothetical protein
MSHRKGQGRGNTAWAPKGKEARPDTNRHDPPQTRPHRAAEATVKQTTTDNLSGRTSEASQLGPARRPHKGGDAWDGGRSAKAGLEGVG